MALQQRGHGFFFDRELGTRNSSGQTCVFAQDQDSNLTQAFELGWEVSL